MVAILVAAGMTVGAGTSPAFAGVSGSLSIGNGVLYDDCRDVSFTYSLSFTPDVDHWSMDVEAIGPDGTSEASAFIASSLDAASGTETLLFCGWEQNGRYELHATGTWDDYDTDTYDQPFTLPTRSFTMRLPKSKTTIKTRPAGKNVRVIVTVKDERPNGYFPTDFATVRLNSFVGGRWVVVRNSKGYTDDGRYAKVYLRPKTPLKIRAVTKESDNYSASKSNPVRVYPK